MENPGHVGITPPERIAPLLAAVGLLAVSCAKSSDPGPPGASITADFSGAPLAGTAPLTVDFTDLSTGGGTSWSWDFGDGGASTVQDPSHVFASAGGFTVGLTVTGPGGSDTAIKVGYVNVAPAPGAPPEITTTTLPGATEAQAYSEPVLVTGGVPPLGFSVTAGALPPGLSLDGASGLISGAPGAPPATGQYTFTVTVTDSDSPPRSDERAYLFNVAPAVFPACAGSTSTGAPPLDDPTFPLYLGAFETGLYAGSDERPPGHTARAPLLEPLDASGNPSASGKYVLVSIGMSNTTEEFCSSGSGDPPCNPWTFTGQAATDPEVNTSHLVIVNGARSGQTAGTWDSPSHPNYDLIRDNRLVPAGLSELQVQAAWVKVANPNPTVSLPNANADAFTLVEQIGDIVRAMRVRYPNLKQVYFSSRIYAGFATTPLNPEPYAYESGFGVKWSIQAQIDQENGLGIDPRAGDLDTATVAAWLSWGPYLWADGFVPRATDGLYWTCDHLDTDGTHPSVPGEERVGNALLHFFKTDPVAREWFLENP